MMRRAATTLSLAVLGSLPFVGAGCVQQDRYDQLISANRSLEEQLVAAEDERDAYQESLEQAQAQAQQYNRELNALQASYELLETDFDNATGQLDDYLRRISAVEMGPLPKDVESALVQLAAAYPDVLTFDPKYGMIRFASDFTFDLGSTELKPDAQQTIAALADIVNSDNVSGFEVRVIGHTDNVPIRQAATRAKHPTNVHLSVHRAISVRDALVTASVSPARIQVAGYGEHRPIVTNGVGGAAENRRVDIFIMPMSEAVDLGTPTIVAEPTRTGDREGPMK